jgi:hypothetical protein
VVFKGLRVRMGVHTDTVTSYCYDQLSHQHRYSGPLMDTARQVSDAAAGGQVLVTQATVSAIQSMAHLASKRYGSVDIIHEGRHFLSEPDIEELDTSGHFRRLLALKEIEGMFNTNVSQQRMARSTGDACVSGTEAEEGKDTPVDTATTAVRAAKPMAEASEGVTKHTLPTRLGQWMGCLRGHESGPTAEGAEGDGGAPDTLMLPSPAGHSSPSATEPIGMVPHALLPAACRGGAGSGQQAATEPLSRAMTMAASFEFASVPAPSAPHPSPSASADAMRSAVSDPSVCRTSSTLLMNNTVTVVHDETSFRPPPPVVCPKASCDMGSPHSSVMLTPLRVSGNSNACSEESHNMGTLMAPSGADLLSSRLPPVMLPGLSSLSTAPSDHITAEVCANGLLQLSENLLPCVTCNV